jgi:hypothetical protein
MSRTLVPAVPPQTEGRDAAPGVVVRPTGDDAQACRAVPAVVAGPRRLVTARLLGALLGDLDALLGESATNGQVPAESWLVLRYGTDPAARAFVPGHRRAQPYPPVGEQPRPPRRVEVQLADPLLAGLSLLVAPELANGGPASARVVLDLLEDGAALVYVVDAQAPIGPEGLELLAAAATLTDAVFVAVVDDGDSPRWPAVAGANQSALARVAPDLALTPWHVLDRDRDLAGLRSDLLGWSAAARRERAAGPVERVRARTGDDGAVSGWRSVLDKEIGGHRQSIVQNLSIELSRIHLRCVRHVVEHGCASLPVAFDRELQGLSVLASRTLRTAADGILAAVLTQVMECAPPPALVSRVALAVREMVREAETWDRALLVITTGGVAEVVGHGALAGLAVWSQPPAGAGAVLPPVALGLTAGCYGMWQSRRSDQRSCQQWVQRAVRGLELELQGEVNRRLDDLAEALGSLVGDAVEHGILLA